MSGISTGFVDRVRRAATSSFAEVLRACKVDTNPGDFSHLRCPLHDDASGSFSAAPLTKGLWICHAGCGKGDAFDLWKAVHGVGFSGAALAIGELLGIHDAGAPPPRQRLPSSPPRDRPVPPANVDPEWLKPGWYAEGDGRAPARVHVYRDPDSRAPLAVKVFPAAWKTEKRARPSWWRLTSKGPRRGLDGLAVPVFTPEAQPAQAQDSILFLVGGEKDADAVSGCGLAAVSLPHGEKAPNDRETAQIAAEMVRRGATSVVVVFDADGTGVKASEKAAAALSSAGVPAAFVLAADLVSAGRAAKDQAEKLGWTEGPDPEAKGFDVADLCAFGAADPDLAYGSLLNLAAATEPGSAKVQEQGPKRVKSSNVKSKPVRWLWRNWLPKGSVVILAGYGGAGKTFAALAICADLSRGVTPGSAETREPAASLYVSSEGSNDTTFKPRLESYEAVSGTIDHDRIGLCDELTKLALHTEEGRTALRHWIEEDGVELVVIDPLSTAIGPGVDSYRGNEVRGFLDPLAEIARDTDACIVLVHHYRKGGGGGKAQNKIGDSAQIVNTARVCLTCGDHPDDLANEDLDPMLRRKLLSIAKSNDGPTGRSIAYKLQAVDDIDRPPGVRWIGFVKGVTADMVVRAVDEGAGSLSPTVSDAVGFLRDALADGPIAAADAYAAAKKDHPVSQRALAEARRVLGVKTKRTGYQRPVAWYWPKLGQTEESAIEVMTAREASLARGAGKGKVAPKKGNSEEAEPKQLPLAD